MPIPFLRNDLLLQKAKWRRCFSWVPHKCKLSNKLIWLSWAYKGTVIYTGPGEPVIEFYWIKQNEFLIAQIKGLL